MRVISGKYKGKNLEGFDIEGTRPTMDRVKESLMASIQNYIKNACVLDLFAGSGSLGIEAISNGAKSCYLVDKNKMLIDIINKNITDMNDEFHVLHSNYEAALLLYKNANLKFDIIFLDPPYKMNLISNSLKLIKEYNLLNKNGIIVCEYETEKIDTSTYEIYKEKKYGNKLIMILK